MRKFKDAVGLACQIVYEYDNWSSTHISDMLSTYESPEKPPCSYDELEDLCHTAAEHKKFGLSFQDAEKKMLSKK